MMLPMLMLILFYEFILKSKFSTQSCVRCAFLFNVDKSWLYELWWVWTQWWQAWNWFPLCNSSDQINRFALHCWFDLCWSSDCHRHCHHCIGSMFNDLSILTPLFYLWLPIRFEFYFSWNIVPPNHKELVLVFALYSSQPLRQYVCTHLFISLKTICGNDKYWIYWISLLWCTK